MRQLLQILGKSIWYHEIHQKWGSCFTVAFFQLPEIWSPQLPIFWNCNQLILKVSFLSCLEYQNPVHYYYLEHLKVFFHSFEAYNVTEIPQLPFFWNGFQEKLSCNKFSLSIIQWYFLHMCTKYHFFPTLPKITLGRKWYFHHTWKKYHLFPILPKVTVGRKW